MKKIAWWGITTEMILIFLVVLLILMPLIFVSTLPFLIATRSLDLFPKMLMRFR